MASVEKIIAKMKNQPNGVRLEEADKVLMACGYWSARQEGSHRHYRNGDGKIITIVQKNPLKKYQVTMILGIVKSSKLM